MKERELEQLITQWIRGELSDNEEKDLLLKMKEEGYSTNEIKEMRHLYDVFGDDEIPEPSMAMDDGFYEMLYSQSRTIRLLDIGKSVSKFLHEHRIVYQVAASILLFVLGWYGGIEFTQSQKDEPAMVAMKNEISDMKKVMMFTMIEQSSPTQRIKAVHMVKEIDKLDSKIIQALVTTLNEDANDNVRLVALETLKGYAHYPQVREGLILSISRQTSPLVQLELANVMIELQEVRSVPHFEEMLLDKTLNYTVRNKVNETLKILI